MPSSATVDWFLYALRCADGTLYTGVTTDPARRLDEHNAGRGARYTAGRRPVALVGLWRFPDRSSAQHAESLFRRLPRQCKWDLILERSPFAEVPFCVAAGKVCIPTPSAESDHFCPHCGGRLATIHLPHDHRERQVCTVCGRLHYRNAKPCAGALITRNGRVLLVRRGISPFQGYWDIPGGFLEEDEHPADGVVREVREETGLEIRLTDLLGFYIDRYLYDDAGHYCLNIYFLAEVTGGCPRPGDDAVEMAWFAPQELPEEIAFDHVREVLADWSRRVGTSLPQDEDA